MSNTLVDLRDILFDTLRSLKKNEMEVDRGRAIGQNASVLVETAKVECYYLELTKQKSGSGFFPQEEPETPVMLQHQPDKE